MLLIAVATAAIAERSGFLKMAATGHGGAARYGDAGAIPGCGRDFAAIRGSVAGRCGAFSMIGQFPSKSLFSPIVHGSFVLEKKEKEGRRRKRRTMKMKLLEERGSCFACCRSDEKM
ncbi:hypothetical protein QL285_050635 [Trifolium repens]|jgi:hypothetical protein|nr:hypothetical protein QL285_050635 [Trifolium repens]